MGSDLVIKRIVVTGTREGTAPAITQWSPADLEAFEASLLAFIGPRKGDGSDPFELMVATPRWLAENATQLPTADRANPWLYGPVLLVNQWDATEITDVVEQFIRSSSAETDSDALARLSLVLPRL